MAEKFSRADCGKLSEPLPRIMTEGQGGRKREKKIEAMKREMGEEKFGSE